MFYKKNSSCCAALRHCRTLARHHNPSREPGSLPFSIPSCVSPLGVSPRVSVWMPPRTSTTATYHWPPASKTCSDLYSNLTAYLANFYELKLICSSRRLPCCGSLSLPPPPSTGFHPRDVRACSGSRAPHPSSTSGGVSLTPRPGGAHSLPGWLPTTAASLALRLLLQAGS